MEDGVPEAESSFLRNVTIRYEEEEAHEDKGLTELKDEEEVGAFGNQLISALVSPIMRSGSRNSEEKAEASEKKIGNQESSSLYQDPGDSGRGVINRIVSSVFRGEDSKDREKEREDESDTTVKNVKEAVEVSNDTASGGIINKIVSSLFNSEEKQSGETEKEEIYEEDNADEGAETSKGSVSGGIIDSIVSHLPPSLPDDAAPTADEASILLHSIIHE